MRWQAMKSATHHLLRLDRKMIQIKKGLDIPIAGDPEQAIHNGPRVRTVALVGFDYVGMKPTMLVKEGDKVKKGQALFTDKKTEGIKYTAPAGGTIAAINRGEKRTLQSVVIDVADTEDEESFPPQSPEQLITLSREAIQVQLVEIGLWTALRTRPYSSIPAPGSVPHSIFVTAIDTNPLAAKPEIIIREQLESFNQGLQLLGKLTDGKVHLCVGEQSALSVPTAGNICKTAFAGPHPAGLAGTHIHFLDAVGPNKTVWTINYQDVVAVGKLFLTGKLYTDRVIALAGPQVDKPRLLRTRLGANLDELCAGELKAGDNRMISGSVLSGRTARGALAYLGRYHLQVSVLLEGRQREFMRYMVPGTDTHSALGIYISSFFGRGKKMRYTTNTNGSERAMVPVGLYEEVMPLDILPTYLLRHLIVGDTDMAQQLGCLEMDEEDLALCTYVCPGKYEYGPILRDNLTRIQKDG
jgi:Na+-transporting NADH:ubiquinone oxidoreductase subunit A